MRSVWPLPPRGGGLVSTKKNKKHTHTQTHTTWCALCDLFHHAVEIPVSNGPTTIPIMMSVLRWCVIPLCAESWPTNAALKYTKITFPYVWVSILLGVCIYTKITFPYVWVSILLGVCIYIYIYLHICIHVYTHTHTHIHMYICYLYMHTETHTQTIIHIQSQTHDISVCWNKRANPDKIRNGCAYPFQNTNPKFM